MLAEFIELAAKAAEARGGYPKIRSGYGCWQVVDGIFFCEKFDLFLVCKGHEL